MELTHQVGLGNMQAVSEELAVKKGRDAFSKFNILQLHQPV
jgi:hypothetical protein